MEICKISLPQSVNDIISMLENAGHRADAVGGAVRDILMGNAAKDYDVATSAKPREIKKVFHAHRVIETGIQHGTVTVILGNIPYEITTYRIDGEYSDSRRPDSVRFTKNLEEDLARRDFTVNAMAYSEKHGLTDCFGGIDDLKHGIIRAVGEPERRFREDALRMLRAIRFAATLGFRIEEKTNAAIFSLKDRLSMVSWERIRNEWRRLIMGINSLDVLDKYREIILMLIPELAPLRLPSIEIWETLNEFDREIALFALNSDAQGFNTAMRRLKSENLRIRFGVKVLSCMNNPPGAEKNEIVDFILNYDDDIVLTSLRVGALLGFVDHAAFDMAFDMISDNIPRTLQMLAIKGCDLLLLGIKGEPVGRFLWDLLHMVARGECENELSSLMALAAAMADNYR